MTSEKLNQIVERQNERLEQEAIDNATRIIAEISRLKSNIANAESQIDDLRAELKKLEITRIDPIQILGA